MCPAACALPHVTGEFNAAAIDEQGREFVKHQAAV